MLKKKTSHCYLLFVRRSIVAGFLPVNAVYGKIRIIYDVSLALVCFAHANCAMRNALRGQRICAGPALAGLVVQSTHTKL